MRRFHTFFCFSILFDKVLSCYSWDGMRVFRSPDGVSINGGEGDFSHFVNDVKTLLLGHWTVSHCG